MYAGILKSTTNTGLDSELRCKFVAPLTIVSVQPTYVQDMLNLRRRAGSQNVQRWEIETNLMPEGNSAEYLVHSVLNGHNNIFHVRMPQAYSLSISTSSFITVNASGQGGSVFAAGVNTINISNAPNLYVGEFIRFAGHNKVYLVTNGGTGGVGIGIRPSLVSSIANEEAIHTNNRVTMYARYDTETRIGVSYTDGVLSDPGTVKLIEAF